VEAKAEWQRPLALVANAYRLLGKLGAHVIRKPRSVTEIDAALIDGLDELEPLLVATFHTPWPLPGETVDGNSGIGRPVAWQADLRAVVREARTLDTIAERRKHEPAELQNVAFGKNLGVDRRRDVEPRAGVPRLGSHKRASQRGPNFHAPLGTSDCNDIGCRRGLVLTVHTQPPSTM